MIFSVVSEFSTSKSVVVGSLPNEEPIQQLLYLVEGAGIEAKHHWVVAKLLELYPKPPEPEVPQSGPEVAQSGQESGPEVSEVSQQVGFDMMKFYIFSPKKSFSIKWAKFYHVNPEIRNLLNLKLRAPKTEITMKYLALKHKINKQSPVNVTVCDLLLI